jgi:hypothetical protein
MASAGSSLSRHQAKTGHQSFPGEIGQGGHLGLVEIDRPVAEEKGHDTVIAGTGALHGTLFTIDQHSDLREPHATEGV